MNEITAPESFELTTNWHAIQYTNIRYNQPNVSQEYNRILKAFGRGSSFVVNGFKLGLFKATLNDEECLIARITPGILIQDWTVIDFVQHAKQYKDFLYVKVFGAKDKPLPKQAYKIGCRYYHGIYGDGLEAMPTYGILESLYETKDRANFKTLYSLYLNSGYGSNGETIDIEHIDVDDFRFPPLDRDPTDPIDPWYPTADNEINREHDPYIEPEDDYPTQTARSQAIMWSLIMG